MLSSSNVIRCSASNRLVNQVSAVPSRCEAATIVLMLSGRTVDHFSQSDLYAQALNQSPAPASRKTSFTSPENISILVCFVLYLLVPRAWVPLRPERGY